MGEETVSENTCKAPAQFDTLVNDPDAEGQRVLGVLEQQAIQECKIKEARHKSASRKGDELQQSA